MNVAGYHVTNKLYESQTTAVYRATRESDGRPVVLKMLKGPHPSRERRARFQREYEIALSLGAAPTTGPSGLVETLRLEGGTGPSAPLTIVQEDVGGESLRRLEVAGRAPLPSLLRIAIAASGALERLHERGVIHRDVTPSNIVYNLHTGELRLIDFGLAVSMADAGTRAGHTLEGTLPYMAPEQTGRTGRGADHRTDFYGLGATLYELFSGRPPFDTEDPLELVHAHLARQPASLSSVRPEVPAALSAVVLKLLAKAPEDRYQSARGARTDLEACLEQLEAGAEPPSFTPGGDDFPDQFQIPRRLYGRSGEVDRLIAAFDRVASSGRTEALLVSGYSGVGKSALIDEVYKPVARHRAYFVVGKFEQLQKNVPYSAISSAFADLARQILTEGEASLGRWRRALREALGPAGRLITDLVPDLALIVGPQPELPELGPSESENRFQLAIQRFVQTFGQPEHPLALFLDDLQWADMASLRLLESLLATGTRHLFLIGAYRDNEIAPAHPLALALRRLRRRGVPIDEVSLAPLGREHVGQLLGDALRAEPASVAELTELVLLKTGGNPFFIGEFLKTLHRDRLVTLSGRRWRWDVEQIRRQGITDNVVDLLLANLRELPAEAQEVLRLAACVGNRFDLGKLSVVCERSLADVATALQPALAEGLVVATEAPRVVGDGDGAPRLMATRYRFAHDRVQQAAYALLDDEQRRHAHLRIGRLLLGARGGAPAGEYLLEIVDHLDRGSGLIDDPDERRALARLNLDAATRAHDATAHQAARAYATAGLSLLGEAPLRDGGELAFELQKELAQAEYLSGAYERSDLLLRALLGHAPSDLARVEIYNRIIVQQSLTAHYDEAIKAGREALRLLDIDLPEGDPTPAYDRKAQAVRAVLEGADLNALVGRPEMKQPEVRAALQVLANLIAPTFYGSRHLYGIVVVTGVELCLLHGHSAESSFAYANYGLVLAMTGEHPQEAYDMGTLALRLSSRSNRLDLRCKVNFIYGTYIHPWRKHLGSLDAIFDEGYQAGLQGGDLIFTGAILVFRLLSPLHLGRPLPGLIEDARRYIAFGRKTENHMATDRLLASYLPMLNLTGATADPLSFAPLPDEREAGTPDEGELLAACREHNSALAICIYWVQKAQILYLYEEYENALAAIKLAEPLVGLVSGTISSVEYWFYLALSAAALYPRRPEAERPPLLEALQTAAARLERFAAGCPENFEHKHLLVAAERARLEGKEWDALSLYDRAIASAAQHEFPHIEALGHELAARFWRDRHKDDFADVHLRRAHQGYRAWGAQRKVELMEAKEPRLAAHAGANAPGARAQITVRSSELDGPVGDALDLRTVLRASRVLAGELFMDSLLAKLVQIMVENAGAERGLFLVEQGGRWGVTAEGAVDRRAGGQASGAAPNGGADFPAAIVNYVANRAQAVVLHRAVDDRQFDRDPYVRERRPRSVIGLPLLNQGKLLGIVYLENNLLDGAFTTERIEVLHLLAAHAASSLANAELYRQVGDARAKVERANEELTAEVARQTVELREANERLVDELEERKRAEGARAALQQQIIEMQEALIAEMSMPLIPVTNEILVLPLIGTIDERRANDLMRAVLAGAEQHRARIIIIDLTGLRQVDPHAAATLLRVASALRLLGARAILTGIRTELAKALIRLDVNLGGLTTRGTLQDALSAALRRPATPSS